MSEKKKRKNIFFFYFLCHSPLQRVLQLTHFIKSLENIWNIAKERIPEEYRKEKREEKYQKRFFRFPHFPRLSRSTPLSH